ncbi:ABC transporter ATP-binding protein [Rhodospirillaceae bacterium SYSU D60014]|uniref:ABC transporter ATP-binding protein n=1 Tax=Virgifigura deserti TaxID=2268457 RepID=UPI000E6671E0
MTSKFADLEADSAAASRAEDETLVEVEEVSKKFARSLRKTLFYAVRDLGSELTGRSVSPVLRADEFWALQGVSFTLRRGEALGIIGPNGAGKSTLLKIITGIIKPTTGFVRTRGRVQALIELSSGMNPTLTGRENIYIRAALLGMPRSVINERFDEIVRFAELEDDIDMPVQNYSSGMRVKLGFSIAINVDPDVLILDEVLAVGDQRFRAKAREAMSALLRRDVALIYISHNMNQVLSITDRAVWLDHGRMKEIGPSREVCSRYLTQQQKAAVDQLDSQPVPINRSIDTFRLESIQLSDGAQLLPKDFVIPSSETDRIYDLDLEFSVQDDAEVDEFYHGLFVGRNDTEWQAYCFIQDRLTVRLGERFKRRFRVDLSQFNPGYYQLGLLILPEHDISVVSFGAYAILRFTVEPREVLQDIWEPGRIHYRRMIDNSLGANFLPVNLQDHTDSRPPDPSRQRHDLDACESVSHEIGSPPRGHSLGEADNVGRMPASAASALERHIGRKQ